MGFANLHDMAYDDDDQWDHLKKQAQGPELPDYPYGLCFSLPVEDLEEAGAEDGEPGDTMRFSAMGEVTAVTRGTDASRVELELTEFAGDDGKFFDLSAPVHICLCEPELDKMDLEADCERGDTIHLVGTLRLESTSDSDFGGKRACLQIVELACEDESGEARED